MDEGVITDLKQFISGVITQQTSDIYLRLDKMDSRMDGIETRLDNRIDGIEQKLDDGFAGIADVIEELGNRFQVSIDDHEQR